MTNLHKELKGYSSSRMTFWLMNLQALSGIKFDLDKAKDLLVHISKLQQEIEDEVLPQLPRRQLKKGEEKDWTVPAKPFKKDGSPSVSLLNFIEKHKDDIQLIDNTLVWNGVVYPIEAGFTFPATLPMELGNQSDLKDWLVSLGWKPTLWNYKRDSRGKPERDKQTGQLIRTTPKLQENGKLCINLEELDIPLVKQVVKWLSLRNRSSVINGWLENQRLIFDACLSAGSTGIANTHRQRHTCVVNLPKADPSVTLGYEMRDLFVARGRERTLVGFDASGLESRVEGHYTFQFDDGAYARELLEGDIHTKNAFVFFSPELNRLGLDVETVSKDDPAFKKFRSKSKNGKYALSYGCSPAKLASTLGVQEARGMELYESFWINNTSLDQLKTRLETFWEKDGGKKWIRGIDGRRINTRSKHSLINALFQSCGAIIMDYAGLFLNRWLGGITYDLDGNPCYQYNGTYVYRVGYMHDEYLFDCDKSVAQDIADLGVKAIIEAGKYLKLKVPLDAEAKIGNSWAEVH